MKSVMNQPATISYYSLDIEQVLYIHEAIIEFSHGASGIREFALLHSALERPKASFAGTDLYPSILEKGAAVMHSLTMNHPFMDGNKRTAFAVLSRFLNANGYEIDATQQDIVNFCLAVDNNGWQVPEILKWLRGHVRPTDALPQ